MSRQLAQSETAKDNASVELRVPEKGPLHALLDQVKEENLPWWQKILASREVAEKFRQTIKQQAEAARDVTTAQLHESVQTTLQAIRARHMELRNDIRSRQLDEITMRGMEIEMRMLNGVDEFAVQLTEFSKKLEDPNKLDFMKQKIEGMVKAAFERFCQQLDDTSGDLRAALKQAAGYK